MNCKTCKYYERGDDGKPGTCNKLIVGDTWNGFQNLEDDGVGYSDEQYEIESSVLYVGENFGCIHYEKRQIEIPSIH